MSSVITLDFEKWKAQQTAAGQPVVLDEFVFANVPNLDPSKEFSRSEKLPAQNQIVHRQSVNKTGLASENAVAYSVTLGTEVGNFDFNWIGLLNKASGVIGMITHAPTQKKIRTANGLQGNVLTRSFLLEFDGAATETAITTTAETWQIDFTARLSGIDEMQRLMNTDSYGEAAFFGDGFAVVRQGEQYRVKKGLAYVGGLRGMLEFDQTLNAMRNTRVYADFSHQGNLVSQWKTVVKITAANELKNYVDAVGYPHYVFAIARIDGNGNVTDLRSKGTFSDRDIVNIQQELGRIKQDYATQKALKDGLDGKQPKGDYATNTVVNNANDNANSRLEKAKNGADILNKAEFIDNLGLKATVEKAMRAVPHSRRINGKWLTSDISLGAGDVDAVSASKGGTFQGDIRLSKGAFIGEQRADLVLSSLGTAKSRLSLNLWGSSSRVSVLECRDDEGGMWYVQRLTNGAVQLAVEGEILPSNYGNFDARYGSKNTANSVRNGWWKCGDTGLMFQWGYTETELGESSETVTFPAEFPRQCFGGVASPTYDKNHVGVSSAYFFNLNDGKRAIITADQSANSEGVKAFIFWWAMGI